MSPAGVTEKALGRAVDFAPPVAAEHGLSVGADVLEGVFTEARSGASEQRRMGLFGLGKVSWSQAELAHFETPVPPPAEPIWPGILRGEEIHLSVGELVTEIEVLLDMREDDSDDGPLLYSLKVEEPGGWRWPRGELEPPMLDQNRARQAELETGYIYHELLYGLPLPHRAALLSYVLSNANRVELVIRPEARAESVRTATILSTGR